jgi:hypothetical protein
VRTLRFTKVRCLAVVTTFTLAALHGVGCNSLVGIEDVTLGSIDGSVPAVDGSPKVDGGGGSDAPSTSDVGADTNDSSTTAAKLTIDKTEFDFGTVVVGAALAPTTFTIGNTGTGASSPLTTNITGTNPAAFTLPPIGDNCKGKSLAPGATCTIKVDARVIVAGSFAAALDVADATSKVSAKLTSKVATPGAISIAPTDKDFQTVVLGGQSGDMVFDVTNTGASATGTLATTVTGTNAGDFLNKVADTCDGMTLAGGGTCAVTLRFKPLALGLGRAATLAVDATPGGTATATLHGDSVAPAALSFTPAPADLGIVDVSSTGSTNVVVKNTGGIATNALGIGIAGPNAAEFTTSGCAGATLAPQGTCTLTVVLAPTGPRGPRSAVANFTGVPGGATLQLTGTARDYVTLAVSSVGSGGGTVSNGSKIDCTDNTGTCSEDIERTGLAPDVTLTAKPDGTSTFMGWNGGGPGCTGTGSCIVKMDAAKNVVATFKRGLLVGIAGQNCVISIAAANNDVLWVDRCGSGAVRICPKTGCTGVPATVVPSGAGHSYWAVGASASGSTEFAFVTDNQYQQGLFRAPLAGTSLDPWGAAQANAGPIAASGSLIVWGDNAATYRSVPGTSGVTKSMNVPAAWSGAFNQGPPIQTVGSDATNVYASNGTDVFKCAVGSVCTGGISPNPVAVSTAAATPNVVALASDGTTLYMTGGTPSFVANGVELLYSVPIAGGAVTTESTLTLVADGGGTHLSVVTDGTYVFWGSIDGNIYRCDKSKCSTTRVVFVAGSHPFGLAQDKDYLYWADYSGGAVFRMPKL